MAKDAQTIEEVVDRLSQIIKQAQTEHSPLGYFAALYRKVTRQIKADIDANRFTDNTLMERFDVIFANRYLAAYDALRAGQAPTQSWAFSFRVAEQWWPIVLQHLLLGINAHINLDLGIAAARTAPGDQLIGLKDDFDRINTVLAGLVGDVQNELAQVWPLLRLMNRHLGSVETALINCSMEKARDAAWDVAQQLAPLTLGEQEREIARLDADVAAFAHFVRYPTFFGRWITRLVRLGERGRVASRIAILE